MMAKKKEIPQVSDKTKDAIEEFLALSVKFKNAWFFKPDSSASSRRKYESRYSMKYIGDGIALIFTVRCSARNVYVSKSVEINGKVTNATALKKFVK